VRIERPAVGRLGNGISEYGGAASGLSGRDWMIDKKDESMKARPEKQASEGAMDIPQGSKVNPNAKAPPVQDRWFDTQLSRMYADLASEPLPKEMMALLDKLKTNKTS
jgi:hypothetical protein